MIKELWPRLKLACQDRGAVSSWVFVCGFFKPWKRDQHLADQQAISE